MSALKELAELEYQERYKNSSMPEHARFRKKYSDRTANQLTQAVITFLKLNNWHAERVNTMGRPVDKTKVTTNCLGQKQRIGSIDWLPSSGQRGSADIHSIINGRFTAIEIKIGRDRQSEAQKEYQKQIEQAGGLYWIVRSFDQLMKLYKEKTPAGTGAGNNL